MVKNIGTTFSIEGIKDLPQSLIDAIEAINEEVNDLAIKKFMSGEFNKSSNIKRFRDVVDRITPVLILISYVDAEKELNRYLQEALDKDRRALQVKEKLFGIEEPIKTEKPKIINAFGTAVSTTEKEEKITKKAAETKAVVKSIIKNIKVAVKEYSSKVTESSYKDIIQYFVSQEQISVIKARTVAKGLAFKIKEKIGANIDAAFVFSDFNSASEGIGNSIKEAINKIIGSNLELSRLLDLGHIAAKTDIDSDTEAYYGNFPKLTQVLFEKIFDNTISQGTAPQTEVIDVNDILLDFLQETSQISNTLTVNKNFAENFLSVFVSVGGQVAKLENAVINQARGRSAERAFPGATSSQALSTFKQEVSKILKTWNDVTQAEKIKRVEKLFNENLTTIFKGQSSPSMLDYIADTIVATLSGKKVNPFKQVSNKSTGPIKRKTNVKGNSVKPKSKSGKLRTKPFNISNIKQTSTLTSRSLINLPMLMMQINSSLHDQIKANMGTGNSRNVLNYRTGRLASSAKVERLSESRQGMITAFYSYMKNPYATFSRGGRQEVPFTRDPKTLISKSIRELAGAQVANRMRAVLI